MYRNSHHRRVMKKPASSGFTLVEMIVAVGLFAVVMMIAVGALLSLVVANRKAQALQSVMNNLNVTLDDMARSVRMGSVYNCNGSPPYNTTLDCPNGDILFAFKPYGKGTGDPSWIYKWDLASKSIMRSEDGGSTFVELTAHEVTIDSLQFFVVGSTRGDSLQPKVVIIAKGTAGSNSTKTVSTFHIQVTAVQRLLDL
jgi:prepilin-type N-terminal cleavage/methylation domain-containing protein